MLPIDDVQIEFAGDRFERPLRTFPTGLNGASDRLATGISEEIRWVAAIANKLKWAGLRPNIDSAGCPAKQP